MFETDKRMKESYGRYRDPDNDVPDNLFDALFSPVQMMNVKEYSTATYSQETMRLVKVGIPDLWTNSIDWREER